MMYRLDVSTLTSDEAVEAARRELEISAGHYKTRMDVSWLFLFAGGVTMVVLAPYVSSLGWPLGMGVALIIAFWCAAESYDQWRDASNALKSLSPFSGSAYLRGAALVLCARSPAAVNHREKVLASGRQLYAFDYTAMIGAAARQEREALAAQRAEWWRELHGLP